MKFENCAILSKYLFMDKYRGPQYYVPLASPPKFVANPEKMTKDVEDLFKKVPNVTMSKQVVNRSELVVAVYDIRGERHTTDGIEYVYEYSGVIIK